MNEIIANTATQETNMFANIIDKIPMVIGAILIVILSFIIAGMLKRIVLNTFAEHNTDDQVSLLVGKVTHIGILIIGFTIALKNSWNRCYWYCRNVYIGVWICITRYYKKTSFLGH